jgi:cytidyltransferase-like protein
MPKKKVVMIFGTFDLLHQGHINLIMQARRHGDYLIAVIARDKTVRELKEKHAHEEEKIRRKNVSKYVDQAVLGSLKDRFSAIKKYKPDVICLGYDQVFFTDEIKLELERLKLKTKVVRLQSFKPELFKTSIIRAKKPGSIP